MLTGSASAAKEPYRVDLESFAFSSGTKAGTTESAGALTLAAAGLSSAPYTDPHGYGTKSYDSGSWTSAWHDPGFAYSQAVASWNATRRRTPGSRWRCARRPNARETKWYVLGLWARRRRLPPHVGPGQGDTDGSVAIDTFFPRTR